MLHNSTGHYINYSHVICLIIYNFLHFIEQSNQDEDNQKHGLKADSFPELMLLLLFSGEEIKKNTTREPNVSVADLDDDLGFNDSFRLNGDLDDDLGFNDSFRSNQ